MNDVEKIIRELELQEVRAFLAGDADRLAKIWHPDLVVNAPHNRLMIGADVTIAAIQSGRLHHLRLDRQVEYVSVQGDVAIAMGMETVLDEAGPYAGRETRRRFTNIWLRYGEDWRMIGRHANIHPADVATS